MITNTKFVYRQNICVLTKNFTEALALDESRLVKLAGYFLERHLAGDYGNVCEEYIQENKQALALNKGRVCSTYKIDYLAEPVFITTELKPGKPSVTTIMLALDF